MVRHSAAVRLALIALGLSLGSGRAVAETSYFGIHVVDDQTGRGVPLVSLRTTFKAEYVTDSGGYVAFNEPGLMTGDDVWFEVRSYGYEMPKGAFGVNGVALEPEIGKSAEIRLKRTQIAQRLYRLTGYGIYRDSALLGIKPPIDVPLLNAKVTGQDTVQTAVYGGKYYWMWQDTDRVGFPLGCFSMTGATAAAGLPGDVDPDSGIAFNYFVDKPGGFARPMAEVKREGTNPIWVDGLTVTRDAKGNERMLARYVAVDSMAPVETGLVLFNDQRQIFERFLKFDANGESTLAPSGRPFRVLDGGKRYVYFGEPVRVEDTLEAASDPTQYEAFTCLTRDDESGEVDRDASGKVRWTWQKSRKRLDDKRLERLVQAGKLKREELPVQLVNVENGKSLRKAAGSIAWNPYLNKWTQIVGELMGDSVVGEIWFATASAPEGPWRAARKVATHAMEKNSNDFYNPIQHEDLARDGGRLVYFEGTFVNTFSGNPHPTPYYNYNNLMYRLDLADPRLHLPDPPPGLTQTQPALGGL